MCVCVGVFVCVCLCVCLCVCALGGGGTCPSPPGDPKPIARAGCCCAVPWPGETRRTVLDTGKAVKTGAKGEGMTNVFLHHRGASRWSEIASSAAAPRPAACSCNQAAASSSGLAWMSRAAPDPATLGTVSSGGSGRAVPPPLPPPPTRTTTTTTTTTITKTTRRDQLMALARRSGVPETRGQRQPARLIFRGGKVHYLMKQSMFGAWTATIHLRSGSVQFLMLSLGRQCAFGVWTTTTHLRLSRRLGWPRRCCRAGRRSTARPERPTIAPCVCGTDQKQRGDMHAS